jgi:hypothetical protein
MGRTADSLVKDLMLDCYPTPGACVDYGLDSGEVERKFRALKSAIGNGVTADMLHAASVNGGGPALTNLIRANNPDKDVAFALAWDNLNFEEDE